MRFRPPALSHPDIEVAEPQVEAAPGGGALRARWEATMARVPLAPVSLAFSTFDGVSYVPLRLTLPLRVRSEAIASTAGAPPPPALLRFHPLPAGAGPSARARVLTGVGAAVLGATGGLALCWAARRRDWRQTPAGRRRAALDRLKRLRVRHADDLPLVYQELRGWLGLGPGASAQDIEAALRPAFPALADELRALECERFAAPGTPRHGSARLGALLGRLSCLTALATAALAAAAKPADDPAAQAAEDAFRQGDFARACVLLLGIRQSQGDSPELLMDLANASWFTGRHVEALGLYEHASRLAPRRPEIGQALAWLNGRLPLRSPGLDAHYPAPVRDRLRPDEWVCLAGVLAGMGTLAAGLLRWWRRRPALALVPGCLAALLCLHCAFSQWTGPYRPGATVRLNRALVLRSAPAEAAAPVGTTLPAGALVVPAEGQADWLLVRTPFVAGWAPAVHCVAVW
jgi:hypothetical protein